MAEEKEKKGKELPPRRPQAKKRDLQNEKRRLRNRSFKASVRTAIRNLEEALGKGDTASTKEKLNMVYSLVDKGVKKNTYKLNKASRIKARLAAKIATA